MYFAAFALQSAPTPSVDPSGIVFAVSIITIIGIAVNVAVHLRSSGKIEGAVLARLDNLDQDVSELKDSRGTMWDKIRESEREIYAIKVKADMKGRVTNG